MQKVKDEIAGYQASTKGKDRAHEMKEADAASKIREEGLQIFLLNCSPRGGRGTPLDYSSDESSKTESQDITCMKRKPVGYCSEVEVQKSDASEMYNAGGVVVAKVLLLPSSNQRASASCRCYLRFRCRSTRPKSSPEACPDSHVGYSCVTLPRGSCWRRLPSSRPLCSCPLYLPGNRPSRL